MTRDVFLHGAAVRAGKRGFILVFVLFLLLGVSVMAVGMIYNSSQTRAVALNYKNRIQSFHASDGMMTLLAQEVLDGRDSLYIDNSTRGKITGKRAWGPGSIGYDGLKAFFAGGPAAENVESDYLGSNWELDDYAVFWRGYVHPPVTGNYVFSVRADDVSAFYLSKDEDPANLATDPICYNSLGLTLWPLLGAAVSSAQFLKAGQRYYFEYYHREATGSDMGQVGWSGPEWFNEKPIPGKRVSIYTGSGDGEEKDTVQLDGRPVVYRVSQVAPDVFGLYTEAHLFGPGGDTLYRAPLNQVISMKGGAVAPPDTLWMKVIFYDFHSDLSNPDFNRTGEFWPDGAEVRVYEGLVQSKGLRFTTVDADYFGMDSIGKPRRGPTPRRSCGVEKWFTRWTPGWYRTYNYPGGIEDCAESSAAHDTSFKNLVFKDSLPFVRRADLGVNFYQFQRSSPDLKVPGFAPLDGRGFGSEGLTDINGTPHNYSFCMELHTRFEHTSGLKLEFTGDDDVWLFINDSLVMDLGFVHNPTNGSVNLDDLPLTFGETYPLDFFYCERQYTGSNINLTTNLPVHRPKGPPKASWKRDYGSLE